MWQQCLDRLETELSIQQFNTWIRPLQAIEDESMLRLLAPNQFVLDWVNSRLLPRINEVILEIRPNNPAMTVILQPPFLLKIDLICRNKPALILNGSNSIKKFV